MFTPNAVDRSLGWISNLSYQIHICMFTLGKSYGLNDFIVDLVH